MGSDQKRFLQRSLEELAQPIRTHDDIQNVSLKFDVLASELLTTPWVAKKLGAERLTEMISSETEVPEILSEIGDDQLTSLAKQTTELLDLSRSSLIDAIHDHEIADVDSARQVIHDGLQQMLPLLDGES